MVSRLKPISRLLVFGVLAVSAFAAEAPGVPNFHRINDHLYRGAQPSIDGFQSLAQLGVRTVVDLRESGARSVGEERIVKSKGMQYVSVPMSGVNAPSDADISKLLALFEDSSAGSVFIHCRRGADRTGTVIACYRVAHDHWNNQKALEEARSFGMSWLERAMQHYVLNFQVNPVNTVAPALSAAPAVP